ncbi:MAG: hypothetical protein QOF35_632 [Actinomycetota bacterium]|nr:hypothetical protein [Actinomycetota bacterium]
MPEAVDTIPPRRERLTWGAVAALTVVLGYLVMVAHNRSFFLQDDSESGAIPNWLYLGDRLHAGDLPILTPDAWMAGNWTVEGQASLWNPVQLAIYYMAPMVDRLDLLAAGVKGCFAILLALGVYRVALLYGARPAWAAVVGAAMPFSGWVLYYDSATWVTALFGLAWMTQAWASGIRYARGLSGPVPVFVFTYLALSIGYVHSAIGMALVSLCVLVGEGLRSRSVVPAAKVAAVAIAAAMCGLITFLPGYLTAAVTWRVVGAAANNNLFTAPWSESLNAAIPTALPAIQGFSSSQVQKAPVSYIAWFVLPVLAFVDWGRVRRLTRELAGPLTLLAIMLVVTAGPSHIGPIRWPARMMPLLAVVVLVLIGVLGSRATSLTGWRGKAVVALVLTVVSVLRSASALPAGLAEFTLWGLALLAAAALLIALRRFGTAPAAGAALLSILAVLWVQAGQFPSNLGVSQWHMPVSRSAAQAQFPDYPGVNIQLGQWAPIDTPAKAAATWRGVVIGNYARTLGLDYVNAYTAVGHQKFASLLCMRWEGGTCQNAEKYLFAHEPTTGLTYADLMGVDRVILIRHAFPKVLAGGAPSGWRFNTNPDPLVRILERTTPRPAQPGRIVDSPGVTVTNAARSTDTAEAATVSSSTGGAVVFSRLLWPGYTATLDGRALPVDSIRGVFVTVRVPADTHGARLALSFRPPGTSLGLYLAAGGAALLVGLTTFDVILRRRRRTPGSSPVAGRTASSFARQESEDFGEVPALLRGLPEA